MLVSEVMSRPVFSVAPETSIREAATLLRQRCIGTLPVLEKSRLVGMVTGWDMVISALPLPGNAGDRPVRDVMSPDLVVFSKNRPINEAAALMGDAQIERLLIVDRKGALVGLLSIGDIAVNVSEVLAGQALGEICENRRAGERGRRIKPKE